MNGWVWGWMDGQVGGWINGQIGRWLGRWMGGWGESLIATGDISSNTSFQGKTCYPVVTVECNL